MSDTQAALGGESFAALFEESLKRSEMRAGEVITAEVVRIDFNHVVVNAGLKSESYIPIEEFKNDQGELEVAVGDYVSVAIDAVENGYGDTILSRDKAKRLASWLSLETALESGQFVTGTVNGKVKGGLTVLVNGIRAFLPGSLLDTRPVKDMSPFEGKTMEFKVIKLDRKRNNVVLSRRGFLEETQKEARDEFLTNLKPGEVRKGVVSSVVAFGAFVDLGGMDGLIHVSELSWKHVDHPSQVVTVGDEVTVQVLEVDMSRERISLSLKATQQDPWQEFASSHEVGELVYGRVTKLVPFGAFVQVGDGIEGLVHISEMSAHHVDAPEQVVTPGEELWVKIIDLDLARRRISISIKQAAEGGELAAEYRGQFEVDEHGNWVGGAADDAEREAAWSDYYKEYGEPAPGEAPAEPAS